MSEFEKKKIEMALKKFASDNFVQPAACKNLGQIRFYINELSAKIEELERQFGYVPMWAYRLLAQYNAKQNGLLLIDFQKAYR